MVEVQRNIGWQSRGSNPVSCATSFKVCGQPEIGPLTHFCIIRQDLPLGVVAAQLVHAAGESSSGNLPSGTIAVVLAARDEQHLERVELELQIRSVPHVAIREPDAPWCGQLMAIGIVPMDRKNKQLRKVTSRLPLLREKKDE